MTTVPPFVPLLGVLTEFYRLSIFILEQYVRNILSLEISSAYMFPHRRYDIMVGMGQKRGVARGISHLSPTVTYIGSNSSFYYVQGYGEREMRMPYIPMVSYDFNFPIRSKAMTVGLPGRSPTGKGILWKARVDFKCLHCGERPNPPVALHNLSFKPDNMNNIIETVARGLILGPPEIWHASNVIRSLMVGYGNTYRDADLAYNPAGLTEYKRVE